jgi:ABC-type antimicrobial peptide transport system permease subunit
MVLGADPGEILWTVLKSALGLASIGLTVGIPAVLLGAGLLSPLLYNTESNDAATLLSAAAFLIVIAVLAAAVPAFRASRLDPVVALRND